MQGSGAVFPAPALCEYCRWEEGWLIVSAYCSLKFAFESLDQWVPLYYVLLLELPHCPAQEHCILRSTAAHYTIAQATT